MKTLNDLMRAFVAELESGEVPSPLAQEFTLANVWADLARLAGETLPPEAAAAAEALAAEPIYLEPLGARAALALALPDLGGLTITDVLQRSPRPAGGLPWGDYCREAD